MKITPIVRRNEKFAAIGLDENGAEKVRAFHASFPMYRETPLHSLRALAKKLGIAGLYVKDESFRFGLNAFKALGGSYAVGCHIAEVLGEDITDLSFAKMVSDETRAKIGDITFVTATDGNHGRGVAWTAKQLRQKAVVYMPKGSRAERLQNIKKEGADAFITDMSYDDTVRFAKEQAEKNAWVLVQDTSFAGYCDVPRNIMKGYGTMALEAYRRIPVRPTHIFLQAGVGSMAGAVAEFFAAVYKNDRPVVVIAEPYEADCIFRTAQAADGKMHRASGNLDTMMAGLACGEVCDIAWNIIENCADFALVCGDDISAAGMRLLARPADGDPKIVSGESGAVTTGIAAALLSDDSYGEIRRRIGLDENSVVLCFSTEGATDTENYERITGEKPIVPQR